MSEEIKEEEVDTVKEAIQNEAAWKKVTEYMESQEVLHLTVDGIINKGVIAHVEGLRGFIPASKLSLSYVDDLNLWLSKEVDVRVIDVDPENKKLVLSAKEILFEKRAREKAQKIANIEIGSVIEGKVESLQPYGAFVDIGDGISGLVHVSAICHKRIKTPAEVLKVGDTVKVKVSGVKDGKVSLNMKELEEKEQQEEETKEFADFKKFADKDSVSTNLGDLLKNIKLD
ncbi:small subunit ribosomal protein S1 [Acetitomaculum ruminis DSM 5522]|uniref:Small subunit ribosomal protein S1 n=1 Tax=Acetitomaculum ruminis DSM 5522 TaxID=1120918 RepID=A0A1I0YFI2_9FIRM|nr:S1 RNA-binding domain-containing protein [Acetitomaculum ruminis]SFB10943.1 small subunit ribosomal protein S1 [Acetitomaculum ruminis DSM 5522]